MGVSLTDCYWFRPDGMESLTWKDVNYHDNGFSEDLAAVMIHGADGPVVDFRLPDLTTDGALQKGWVLLDGMPVLVKFGDFGDHAISGNPQRKDKIWRRRKIISGFGPPACYCRPSY